MKRITLLNVYKISVVALVLAVGLPLMAAETGQINYQARLLDSYGRRVNTTVDLSFKIYDAVTAGNLLWSETQAGVVVQDGVYSVMLGAQTNIPASVFAQNNVYLELGINGETMTPRQQITASGYSLVARTVMGSNIYENQTSGDVGIGTTNPVVKLDVGGTVQATGFKMPTGATVNYVLASDASGVGTWQPYSAVVTEHDPIHTNWVRVVYTPATNSIWGAIGAEATTRAAADTALQVNIDASSNALNTAITNEAATRAAADGVLQGNINTASNALNANKLNLSGGIMTGPLTNEIAYYGNGAGLTNIPSGGVSLTGVVQRTGDTMSGALIVSNNLTVALTNAAGATNYISLAGVAISNWNQVGGGDLTNDLALLQGSTNALQIQATALQGATGTLNTATNALQIQATALQGATGTLNTATNALQIQATALQGATNTLNTRAIKWDNAVVITNNGPASVTVSYSNIYYLGKDGSWSNAGATSSATAGGLLGLALGNSPVTDGLLLNGHCTNAWGFAANQIGQILYLATNNNHITVTRPTGTNHFVRIVGYVVNANEIYFNPDRTYIEILGGE